MKNIKVIYHKNCADGFAAALSAWIKFKDNAEYIPCQYGDKPPDVTNKEVYILDFSFKRDVLISMNNFAKSLIVLDHHKTAEDDLKGLDFAKFDMEKSGAVLSWEYFHKGNVPEFFLLIQDRDLWKWKRAGSKEISAALQMEPMIFENWHRFLDMDNLYELEVKGKIILEYQQYIVDKISRSDDLEMQTIDGHLVPCINTTSLISEIGNELSKNYPFSASYFETKDKRVYSLRSSENGIDVSIIAKKFGGGGHFHAAGFSIQKPEINLIQ